MISKTAIGSIHELQAKGLHPAPEDIIRLNALGLKLEAARKKNATVNALDYLPRVAAISQSLSFRQPTIGHEIWLEKVERITEPTYETALAVKAYALSRPVSDLPDPDNPSSVKTAVETFAAECADFTRDQIYAALDYVIFGASPLVGENAASRDDDEGGVDVYDGEDWNLCVAAGILHEGRSCLFGVNCRELESMTRRQLEELIRRVYFFHNIEIKPEDDRRLDDYYTTLDVIEERLKKEKENG